MGPLLKSCHLEINLSGKKEASLFQFVGTIFLPENMVQPSLHVGHLLGKQYRTPRNPDKSDQVMSVDLRVLSDLKS